jgi:putative transposase
MQRHAGRFPVAALCRITNVSRSGYYAWLSRKPSERQSENETLLCRIRQFFERSKRTYGSPRGSCGSCGRRGLPAASTG